MNYEYYSFIMFVASICIKIYYRGACDTFNKIAVGYLILLLKV